MIRWRRFAAQGERDFMAEDTTAPRISSDGGQAWDRLRVVSWLAGAVLATSLILAAWGYQRERRIEIATRHDNALVIATERLLSSLKDVETGQRGFIITGKEQYLEPYHWGSDAVGPDLETVATLIGPEASLLSGLVETRLKEAAVSIETYRTEGPAAGAALIQSGSGKTAMDRVRVEVAREQKFANDRLQAASASRPLDDRCAPPLSWGSSCPARASATWRSSAVASTGPARLCSTACSRTHRSASAFSIARSGSGMPIRRSPE